MELSDLVGRHMLNTAAVLTETNNRYGENEDILCIGIDGKTFTFAENADDGYRSYLREIECEDGLYGPKLVGATIINRPVWIDYISVGNGGVTDWGGSGESDLIKITDEYTGHVWAFIGTINTDDYYPSCVLSWNALDPEKYKDIAPQRPMLEIPIEAAEAIAKNYGYDQVVIYARRVGSLPHPNGEHMTTYGVNKEHCAVAAKMAAKLQNYMGWKL